MYGYRYEKMYKALTRQALRRFNKMWFISKFFTYYVRT